MRLVPVALILAATLGFTSAAGFTAGRITSPTKTKTVRLIEPGVLVPKPDGTHELIPLHELEGATQPPGAPDEPR